METLLKPLVSTPSRPSAHRKGRFAGALTGLVWLVAGVLSVTAAQAQSVSIYLKDGEIIPTEGLRRDGGTVLAKIKTPTGGIGEIGYPADNILRIDFPEPAAIKAGGDLLKAGKSEEAARQLAPVLAFYAPFRDLPGNWWMPLALLQADALTRLARDREADAILNDIARLGGANPDLLRTIKVKQAVIVEHRGDHRKALDALEPIVKDPINPPYELSEAWLAVGSARLALHDYRLALLAFLHVPVYTPEQTLLMPPALLGSAVAYVGLEDVPRAQATFKRIIEAYPNSSEAAEAKTRLQKLATSGSKPQGT